MSDSFTLSLSGTSSILEASYFPPIDLSAEKNYAVGLVGLSTFNSIPNVDNLNNKFHIADSEPMVIPVGSYEVDDISLYLREALAAQNVAFSLLPNQNTLRSKIHCDRNIDFRPDSLFRLPSIHNKS